MTINHRLAAEVAFFKNYITSVYPSGIVSYVSDTYNFWDVITHVASKCKQEILDRKPNALGIGKVVFRPDSGDPAEILCGVEVIPAESIEDAEEYLKYETAWESGEEYGPDVAEGIFSIGNNHYKVTVEPEWNRHDKRFYYIDGWCETKVEEVTLTPEQKGAVQCLWDIFGGTVTPEGYKVLNERVGLIYGDSITLERANDILARLQAKGFASCNVVFGIGSFTYAYNTRDTYGFAIKATYVEIDGVGQEIFKDPVTDGGTKKSAKGLLKVTEVDGEFVLEDQVTPEEESGGSLQDLYVDGEFFNVVSFNTVRSRIDSTFVN
jgi:nicotinamide phosphoribosyltransferase